MITADNYTFNNGMRTIDIDGLTFMWHLHRYLR